MREAISKILLSATVAGDFNPQPAVVCNALSIGNGYDDLGALDIGDAELINDLADVGALPFMRQAASRAVARRGGIPRPVVRPGTALPARRLIPQVPGAPAVGIRLQPLGFNTVAFTASSGTALTADTRPQRPFKGKRLVVDLARTGASATGLVTVTQLSIGTNNQFVSTRPIGVSAFAATAFDTNVELAACTTAIDITVGYNISVAPTMTDRVDIATTMFGEAVG